jgi:beta-N-acetylhexosaminidase
MRVDHLLSLIRSRGARASACLLFLCACSLAAASHAAPARGSAAPAAATGTRLDAALQRRVARMSLAAKVGQIFMVSFPGTVVTQPLLDWLRISQVGGVILFSRNVATDEQLSTLLASANRTALAATGLPLLIGIDEEGGVVRRIQYGPASLPAPAYYGQLGAGGATELYHDAYRAGLALRRLGISINFAPVVDVLSDAHSPIGTRSFGANAFLDGQLASAAIKGYQDAGVAATAKHFLGLGNTWVDAHNDLPTITLSRAWLESHDMVPFRAAIAAGVDALMTTHVVLPALDPSLAPADLSHPIVSGIIRGELGFQGLIVADSLLMGAVTSHLGIAESAVRAVAAGNDLILLAQSKPYPPATMRSALLAVEAAVRSGRIPLARLDAAVGHVLALKVKLGLLRLAPGE